MTLRKLTIAQLDNFIRSGEYLSFDELPITPLRALSQAGNPKALPDDVVLTLALSAENELLGYIGALPERAGNSRCAWNSCWWVKKGAPAGVSMKLLYSFISDWDRKVFFADMTRHTCQLILQLRFCEHTTLKGTRFYYRLRYTDSLLRKRSGLLFFLPIVKLIDLIVNALFYIFRLMVVKGHGGEEKYQTEQISFPPVSLDPFLADNQSGQLVKRFSSDFQWIAENQWVTTEKLSSAAMEKPYFFSWHVTRYELKWINFMKEEETKALLGYSIRDNLLQVCYLFSEKTTIPAIGNYLLNLLKNDRKLSSVITYHHELRNFLNSGKGIIFKRDLNRFTALSKTLAAENLSAPYIPQMGDGDCIFT